MRIAGLCRALKGEVECGDAFLIARLGPEPAIVRSDPRSPGSTSEARCVDLAADDRALVAVVDGLGHGPEAALAAETILDALAAHRDSELEALVKLCHEAARHTRGAALGVARVDCPAARVRFVGVGNVRLYGAGPPVLAQAADQPSGASPGGRFLRAFITNNGIVGYNLPPVMLAGEHQLRGGDVFGLCSDGIALEACFSGLAAIGAARADEIALQFMATKALARDDAAIVVMR